MKTFGVLVLFVAGMEACVPSDNEDPGVIVVDEGPLVVSSERSSLRPTLEDTLGLHVIRDIAVYGDTVVVADRNPRIVMVDRSLEALASFGRLGQGPGELRSPTDIAAWSGGVVVLDRANNRVSRFDYAGDLVGTVSLEGAPVTGVAVDSRGRALMTVNDSAHYLMAVEPDGAIAFAAPRQARFGGTVSVAGESFPVDWDRVVITAGDTIHVADGRVGAVNKYSPVGDLVSSRRLPEPLRTKLLEGVGAHPGRDGVAARIKMPFQDFEAAPDGRLLLTFLAGSLGDTIGMVLDPNTYNARLLIADIESPAWTQERAAVEMALHEDGLLVGWFTGALIDFELTEKVRVFARRSRAAR